MSNENKQLIGINKHAHNNSINSLTSFAGTQTRGAASPLCPTCLRPLLKSYVSSGCQMKFLFILVLLGLSSATVEVIEPKAEQQNSGSTININKRPAAPADAPLESGSIGAKIQYEKQTDINKDNKLSN